MTRLAPQGDARERASVLAVLEEDFAVDDRRVVSRSALHVTTGPAVTYWNPANTASGDYTVKATFKEPAYMALNDHPSAQTVLAHQHLSPLPYILLYFFDFAGYPELGNRYLLAISQP